MEFLLTATIAIRSNSIFQTGEFQKSSADKQGFISIQRLKNVKEISCEITEVGIGETMSWIFFFSNFSSMNVKVTLLNPELSQEAYVLPYIFDTSLHQHRFLILLDHSTQNLQKNQFSDTFVEYLYKVSSVTSSHIYRL